MKYTFDYKETLERRVEIYAANLGEAIMEMYRQINDEEIVLDSQDFAGATLSLPVECNPMVKICDEGEGMSADATSCMDIEIDWW